MNYLMQLFASTFCKYFEMDNTNIDKELYNETFNLHTHYSFFDTVYFESQFIVEIFEAITDLIANNQIENDDDDDYKVVYERELEYIWND